MKNLIFSSERFSIFMERETGWN